MALIDNDFYLKTEQNKKKVYENISSKNIHWHSVASKNACYFNGHRWILGAKDPYQQYQCKWVGCKKGVTTFAYATPLFGSAATAMLSIVLRPLRPSNWSCRIMYHAFFGFFIFSLRDF